MIKKSIGVTLAVCAWTSVVLAALTVHSSYARETNFAGRAPSVQELIDAFRAPDPNASRPRVRTRRISFASGSPEVVADVGAGRAAAYVAPANTASVPQMEIAATGKEVVIDIPQEQNSASFDQIRFDFNSAQLTADSRAILQRIALALNSPELARRMFIIEGHTDAVGSDAYNMRLSQRRAQAVLDYLVRIHGVEPRRLHPIGLGESELLDERNPDSGANRRVVFALS